MFKYLSIIFKLPQIYKLNKKVIKSQEHSNSRHSVNSIIFFNEDYNQIFKFLEIVVTILITRLRKGIMFIHNSFDVWCTSSLMSVCEEQKQQNLIPRFEICT